MHQQARVPLFGLALTTYFIFLVSAVHDAKITFFSGSHKVSTEILGNCMNRANSFLGKSGSWATIFAFQKPIRGMFWAHKFKKLTDYIRHIEKIRNFALQLIKKNSGKFKFSQFLHKAK